MKITKKELKDMVQQIVEESKVELVEEAKIKRGHEMFDTLNQLGKLLKKKERLELKIKEVGKEIKPLEPAVKRFIKTLDDKIAETNRVIIDLKEIEAKMSQTPKYKKMAQKLWKELKNDETEFGGYAEQFKEMTGAKDSLGDVTVKRGRSAYEFEEQVVEEGILDSLTAIQGFAKGAVEKVTKAIKGVISLFTKNDENLKEADKFIKKANKAIDKEEDKQAEKESQED
jgi:hypothetical protein